MPGVAEWTTSVPVAQLAVGVLDMTDVGQVEDMSDEGLYEMAFAVLAGWGGIALSARSVQFSLSAWSEETPAVEVARFNYISARLAVLFAPAESEAS